MFRRPRVRHEPLPGCEDKQKILLPLRLTERDDKGKDKDRGKSKKKDVEWIGPLLVEEKTVTLLQLKPEFQNRCRHKERLDSEREVRVEEKD